MDLRMVCVATTFLLVAGCNREPVRDCTEQARPAYSLVAIEMEIRHMQEEELAGQKYDYSLAGDRFAFAGPSIVPEFKQALEDRNPKNKQLAGIGLRSVTVSEKWPEAYRFIIDRLKQLPKSDEAKWLLYALAHDGVEKYPELIPYAAYYLNDESYVVSVIAATENAAPEYKFRDCDYACYILQMVTKNDFGAKEWHVSNDAVEKAREWVRANPGKVNIKR